MTSNSSQEFHYSEVDVETKTVTISEGPPPVETEKDGVEEAAEKFAQTLPYVAKLANAVQSKGGLVRVLHAFAEFPLGKEKPRLFNQQERLLFNLMHELTGYKSTLLTHFMKQQLEAEKNKEISTNGGTDSEVKEETNV